MSENPYQKFEEEKDKRDEIEIRDRIQSISERLGKVQDKRERLKYLKLLYDLYETIRIEYGGNTSEEKNIKNKLIREMGEILDKRFEKLVEKRKSKETKENKEKDNEGHAKLKNKEDLKNIISEDKEFEKEFTEYNEMIRRKIKEDNPREF